MKFRKHRGGLCESMETTVEIEPTMDALVEHLRVWTRLCGFYSEEEIVAGISPETLHVKAYGYDKRIDWDTYIVHSDAMGVFGFTNGPLVEGNQNAKQIGETKEDNASSSPQ